MNWVPALSSNSHSHRSKCLHNSNHQSRILPSFRKECALADFKGTETLTQKREDRTQGLFFGVIGFAVFRETTDD